MHELISETNIEWKEEYGIGVEGIDSDHQELFRHKSGALFSSPTSNPGNRTQWAAEEGIKYPRMHDNSSIFDREEQFMREIAYEGCKKASCPA